MSWATPSEIWCTILKYAISVPLFFDTNPAEGYGVGQLSSYTFENDYWTSERHRVVLRCVCSSWDRFLSQYNHRYVRLTDVCHQRIPRAAIASAIRIRIQIASRCKCAEFCTIQSEQRPYQIARVVELREKSMALLREYINEGPEEWNLEILHGWFGQYSEELDLIKARAPRLRAMLGMGAATISHFGIQDDPLETFLGGGNWRYDSTLPSDKLNLSNLTTLQIVLRSPPLDVSNWNLPQLHHLSLIYYGTASTESNLAVGAIISQLGGSLRTFHLEDDDLTTELTAEIWTWMPELEQIQIPRLDHILPPAGHPLRIIQIPNNTYDRILPDNVLGPIQPVGRISDEALGVLSGRSGLRIQTDSPWLWLLFNTKINPNTIASMIDLAEKCASIDKEIRLTDVNGVVLHDYLVFAIRAYWKEGLAQRRIITRLSMSDSPFLLF